MALLDLLEENKRRKLNQIIYFVYLIFNSRGVCSLSLENEVTVNCDHTVIPKKVIKKSKPRDTG